MTNQEWIQSLNKNELAKFMAFGIGFYDCEICPDNDNYDCGQKCVDCISGWLEAEHIENEERSDYDQSGLA